MSQDKTCPTCGGKKVVSCVACGAKRNSLGNSKDVSTWASCHCCGGSGEMKCPECDGKGSVVAYFAE